MKQTLFMFGVLGAGFVAGFIDPLLAFLPYYLIAILQPHDLWDWALPSGIRWSFAAAGIGLLFFTLHLPRLFHRVQTNPVAMLMVLYGVLLGVSCLTAYNPVVAQGWFVTIAKTLFIAILVGLMLERWSQLVLICATILGGAAILAWHFNSLYLFERRLDIFFLGLGALDNNGIALTILMGLPFCYAFFWGLRNAWLRAGAAAIGALTLHAVILSYSRGAMLAGVAGLIYLACHHRPRWHVLWGAPLVVAGLAIMAGPEVRQEFNSIYTNHQHDDSARSRLQSWRAGWEIAWDHPLTGVGVRNANLYSHNYGADIAGRTIHNQYFQLAADAGIPCLLVYLTMIGLAFMRTRGARHRLEEARDELSRRRRHAGHERAPHDAPDDARTRRLLRQLTLYSRLLLGVEAMIVTFSVGALFLSLETFEVVLLAVVIGGAAPRLAEQYLETIRPRTELADETDAAPDRPQPSADLPPLIPAGATP